MDNIILSYFVQLKFKPNKKTYNIMTQYNSSNDWLSLAFPDASEGSNYDSGIGMSQFARNSKRLMIGAGSYIKVYDIDLFDQPQWLETTSVALTYEFGGNLFSVTDDGRFVAARSRSSLVQVWEIIDPNVSDNIKNARAQSLGNPVYVLCDKELSSIKLTHVGTSLYLLVGCDSYLSDRGRVFAYEMSLEVTYKEDGGRPLAWKTFLPSLKGRNAGDRFGHSISVVAAPNKSSRVLRLAIGSPGYNDGQGMVQVFVASRDRIGWSRQGEDMTGRIIGEKFGASIDMSSGEISFLLVGSPHWKRSHERNVTETEYYDGRGIVRLFHWRSERFGSSKRWATVDSLVGSNKNDRFGSAVTITRNGARVSAATGGATYNKKQASYVKIFDRHSYDELDSNAVGVFVTQHPHVHWSQSFAMNEYGSMLAIPLSNSGREINVFLDPSPFCQAPGTGGDTSNLESFVDRSTCRSNGKLITNSNDCSDTTLLFGELHSCTWKDNISTPPSASPSSQPAGFPTFFPSLGPTVQPGNPSRSPTQHPSTSPSMTFSKMPTFWPSVGPLDSFSGAPTSLPSLVSATGNPTITSSLYPTEGKFPSMAPRSHSSPENSFSPTFEGWHLRGSTEVPTLGIETGDGSKLATAVISSVAAMAALVGLLIICRRRKSNAHGH